MEQSLGVKRKLPGLLRGGQVHLWGVIENPAAIGAIQQILTGLARDLDLGGQDHVTPPTDPAFNAHNHAAAPVGEEVLVAVAFGRIDDGGDLAAVGFEAGEALLEVFFVGYQVVETLLDGGIQFLEGPLGGGDFEVNRVGLFHEFELAVFELADGQLALIDLVGERAVLLVFLGLILLDGVFGDLLFLFFDLEFGFFAFDFEGLEVGAGGDELILGGRLLFLQALALGGQAVQFRLNMQDFPVMILESQQLLDGFEHDIYIAPTVFAREG